MPASWRARRRGQPLDHAEDGPVERRGDGRREHAELRLLELLALEGEARDQERDREPDAARPPPPAIAASSSASRTAGRRVARATAAEDAERLADHVAEQDPEGDRRRPRL